MDNLKFLKYNKENVLNSGPDLKVQQEIKNDIQTLKQNIKKDYNHIFELNLKEKICIAIKNISEDKGSIFSFIQSSEYVDIEDIR